jgi:hypothetical protein
MPVANNGTTLSGSISTPVTRSNQTPTTETRSTTDATSSTQLTVEEQDSERTFAGEAVKRIEPIIELFRTKKVKKSQAVFRIGQIIASEPTGNEQLKSDTLERYAATLDQFEALAASANKHGNQVAPIAGPMHERRAGESGKRSRGLAEFDRNNAEGSHEDDVDHFLAKLSKGLEPGVEQEDQGEASGDDSEQEVDNEVEGQGRSNKKQKIYESQMPWFSTEQQIRKSNTHRSCNKTRDIIETLQRDPATVKRWIRCATSA